MSKKINKGVFNFTTLTLSLLLGMGFYVHIQNSNLEKNIQDHLVKVRNNLSSISRDQVLAIQLSSQDAFLKIKQESDDLYYDISYLERLKGDLRSKVLVYSVDNTIRQINAATTALSELNNYLRDVLKNETILLQIKETQNRLVSTVERGIDYAKALSQIITEKQKEINPPPVVNALKALSGYLNDFNQYAKAIKEKNKKQSSAKTIEFLSGRLNYLASINVKELGIQDPSFPSQLKGLENQVRQLKEDFSKLNSSAAGLDKLNTIVEMDNFSKLEGQVDQALLELEKSTEDLFDNWLILVIILMNILLVIKTFLFLNSTAELRSSDKKRLDTMKVQNERISNLIHSMEQIVKVDARGGLRTISSDYVINEETYRETEILKIVARLNYLVRRYSDLFGRLVNLRRISHHGLEPIANKIELLRRLQKNNEQANIVSAEGEYSEVLSVLEDLNREQSQNDTLIDKVNANLTKLDTLFTQSKELLSIVEEGHKTVREDVQSSSKLLKSIGETSQNAAEAFEDITSLITDLDVFYLNMKIECLQQGEKGGRLEELLKQLRSIIDGLNLSETKFSTKIKDIQGNSKEVTSLLEQLGNNVIAINNAAEKLDKLILLAEEAQKQSTEYGNTVYSKSDLLDNKVKSIKVGVEELRDKDVKKSEVISLFHQVIKQIYEQLK